MPVRRRLRSTPGPRRPAPALDVRGERCTVRIWKDTCAADDQGDEAAAWFSAVVGRPLRLVRFPDDGVREDRNSNHLRWQAWFAERALC